MSNTNNIQNAPIGVIDSGIGGLTVLRELLLTCPNEYFIYIGDDVNSPYGTREAKEIQQLSLALAKHSKFESIKALVIACNTITAAALDVIEANIEIPVIGVIDAGVSEALAVSKNLKIGILATTATVNSGVFDRALKQGNANAEVTSVGAPKMHEYAENNLDLVMNNPTPEIKQCVRDYMQPFIDAGCDTILMACTHFPPFENLVRDVVGSDVKIVSPSKNTAESLRTTLQDLNLSNSTPANPTPAKQTSTNLSNQAINSANITSANFNYEIISTAGNDEKYAKFSELLLQ